jgi:hypothetical protein
VAAGRQALGVEVGLAAELDDPLGELVGVLLLLLGVSMTFGDAGRGRAP